MIDRRGFLNQDHFRISRHRGLVCTIVVLAALLWTQTAGASFGVPGVGPASGGVGIVLTNLDADPRPDLILMGNDVSGSFRYRVGRNLDANGKADQWSSTFFTVGGSGQKRSGAGAAITSLDLDSRPELILMDYEPAAGKNIFRYTIGWNLDGNGKAARWGSFTTVEDAGPPGDGANLVITNIDADPRPEMIIVLYDGANARLRYKIGWNLHEDGRAERWDEAVVVDGIGSQNSRGPGAVIMNLDDDPRPDLVIMTNDTRHGKLSFNIGWNLDSAGRAQRWSADAIPAISVAGNDYGPGAGLVAANLDNDPRPDLIVMSYTNPADAQAFRYTVLRDTGQVQRIRLEMDKFETVDWPAPSVTRAGSTYTLASIYARLGIELTTQPDNGSIADLHPGRCYKDSELDSLLSAHMNGPIADPNGWHMYALLVSCSTESGTLGLMFDSGQRRGFAVFMDEFKRYPEPGRSQKVMRTLVHELGHALCLYHSDGDAWREEGAQGGTGRTIMNQTWTLSDDWGYAWYAPEYHRIYSYGKNLWMPGSGISFHGCQP